MLYKCCSLDWPYSLLLDLALTTLAVTEMDGTSSGESVKGLPSLSTLGNFLWGFLGCSGMLLHQVYVPYIAGCHMWVSCLNMYVHLSTSCHRNAVLFCTYVYTLEILYTSSAGTTMYSSLAAVKCGCIPVHFQSIEMKLWYRF